MKTNKNITDKLERSILAGALFTFRTFERKNYTTSKIIFASSIDCGVFDMVEVDVKKWKITRIDYKKWDNNKIIDKLIVL